MQKNKPDLLTYNETCKILQKSRRTISRYIKDGLIKPKIIDSKKGTSKYQFDRKEIEKFKKSGKVARTKKPGHETRQDMTHHDTEVIEILKNQLSVKDKQITNLQGKIDKLIERQRETNYLLKGLQDKILLLENKTNSQDRGDTGDKTGHKIRKFFDRLLGKK